MRSFPFLRYLLLLAGISMLHAGGLLALPLAEAAVATDSLVGYWKLDETAGTEVFDSSGNNIHGDHVGSPVIVDDVPSVSFTNPKALQFGGTNYVLMDSTLQLADYTQGTISAWFKRDVGSDGVIFANADNDSTSWFFNMQIRSSGSYATQIRIGNAADRILIETSDTFDAEVWQHVAFTNDGSAYTVYFNGVEVPIQLTEEGTGVEGIWFDDLLSNGEANAIGALARSSVSSHFEGSIDDVRIYDRALSAAEVAQLAAGNHPTAIWDGSSSTDWETAANWDTSAIPDPYTNILIQATSRKPRLTVSASGSSITIESGASLDVSGYDFEFTDGGALKGAGTLRLHGDETLENIVNSGTGTVFYYGSGSYSGLAAGNNYYNLAIEDPTEAGLVGYWKFDETASGTFLDSSGNGNSGTGQGTGGAQKTPQPTADKPSLSFINERALDFDGTDDYVLTGTNPAGAMNAGTVSVWVKADAVQPQSSAGLVAITRTGVTANGVFFVFAGFDVNRIQFAGRNSSSTLVFNRNGILVDNTSAGWVHLAGTWDGDDQVTRVYSNGVSKDEAAYSIPGVLDTTGEVQIARYTAFSREFAGQLDDVRIYDRALSAAEIQNLANGNYANASSGTADYTLTANLDVSTLSIYAGSISAGTNTLDVSGDWNNHSGTGGFVAGTSTVDLDGTSSQDIRGSTDFYNFEASTASTQTISFGSGTTQSVSNAITFTGQESNLLTLAPLTAGATWLLDVSDSATQTLSYVSPSYSDASAGALLVCADNCTDGDNNVNWQFTVPTVAFSASAQTVSETGTGVTVTLSLSAATEVDVSVPFTVTGTATDGTDYTLVNASPVRIAAGQTSTGITVTLIDDGDVESDETIILTIGSPTNATQGATVTHTITITSDEVAPSASSSSSSSSVARVQSGGGRGSSLYTQERIEAAFAYILALFDGKRTEQQDMIADEGDRSGDPGTDDAEGETRRDTPALIAARRNRLFAIVNEQPVIYADVLADAWYAPYISYVVEEEIAQGYKDEEGNPTGEFGTASPVTRSEILKMALEASGAQIGGGSPRNATAQGSWAGPYVHHAEQEQLSVFDPSADVHQAATRAEVMQTILEVMGIPTGAKIPSPFADVPDDHPYVRAITIGYVYGFVEGDTSLDGMPLNTFRPDEPMNRAEVAKIIALVKEVLK